MSKKNIAIVEDEPDLLANYQATLQQHGYQTTGFSEDSTALQYFSKKLPDLVILDIGLGQNPDAGFELCRYLRQRSSTLPILMLTARDDEIDVVSGLRLGADDYLSKDISMQQLLARITGLFRRQQAAQKQQTEQIKQQQLTILTDNLQIFWNEQLIDCTVTEFWLILSLAKRPGQVKTREQLMQDANIFVDDSTITSHIKRIRKKFQKIDQDFAQIDTVHGMGYRWKP